MKKLISMLLVLIMITVITTGCSAQTQETKSTKITVILLQIGNPVMTVNGVQQEIDPGRGTVPVLEEGGRTLLPVRAVVEAMGGAVAWEEDTQMTALAKGDTLIFLTIGSHTAFLNEEPQTLDIAPTILNDRTMLPIRFIAENLGFEVEWDGATQTITLTSNALESDGEDIMGTVTDTSQIDKAKSDSIVVYFSQTGNTRSFAIKIAEIINSDIYEIIPKTPYTTDDIDYSSNDSRANKEQKDEYARPAISGEPIDLSKYDTVYLGYPIWWGTIPRIINTFIDTYELSDKTVMPFCTSGGSSIATSVSAIEQNCPNADIRDGLRGSGQTSDDEINQWIIKNGLTQERKGGLQ